MEIERVEEIRKRKLFTQSELAKSIGITTTGYQKMIKSGDLKVSTLENICAVLGVNISAFFTEKSLVAEPVSVYQKGKITRMQLNPTDKITIDLRQKVLEITAKEV